tara:strand:+ start:8259 stop:8867 length:609 start_codon:yes stop_codon:yes gene_type:complete
MFKKIASEALGLSDIGKIIGKEDFDKVDTDDYIMHEENEKIYFLIKSKKDEYCFTNKALIHLDGESAVSSKRVLKRYDYKNNTIKHVRLETAGRIDLDIEIKFIIGEESFSIDVDKKQLEDLKDLYKALHKIGSLQSSGEYKHTMRLKTLDITKHRLEGREGQITPEDFTTLSDSVYDWLNKSYKSNFKEDYSKVFELYIKN